MEWPFSLCIAMVYYSNKKPFLKKQRTSWSINNWVVCVTLPGIYHLFCQTKLLLLCNDSILHNVLDSSCPSFEPFKCPGEEKCIAIQVKSSAFKTTYFYSYFQYLCDGAVDCNDGYDEDTNLCTAGITVNQSQVFVFVSHYFLVSKEMYSRKFCLYRY